MAVPRASSACVADSSWASACVCTRYYFRIRSPAVSATRRGHSVCVAAHRERPREKLPQEHGRLSGSPHRVRLRDGHRDYPFRVAPQLEKIGPSLGHKRSNKELPFFNIFDDFCMKETPSALHDEKEWPYRLTLIPRDLKDSARQCEVLMRCRRISSTR